jgi:hypothetical protein
VRVFHPDDWRDLEDEAEWRRANRWMAEHNPERLQYGLDWRAEVRWCHAVNDWYNQHPEADHRLEDLRAKRERRRAASG